MKTCTNCKQSKTLDSFTKVACYSEERRAQCKNCRRNKTKEWRKANPERNIAHTKKYQAGNIERTKLAVKKYQLNKKFGITLEQYDAMLAAQDGKCAICSEKCVSGRKLAVDHNHHTNKNRGLLCSRCNMGLGLFLENKAILNNAIEYVRKYEKN
jgi:hypothetical protein